MLVYQFFFEFKRFVLANVVLAGLMAYICEPIFIWIGYYELNSWSLTYSFIFYITAAILARWLVMKLRPKQ
jgi:zinc transporter ZupT